MRGSRPAGERPFSKGGNIRRIPHRNHAFGCITVPGTAKTKTYLQAQNNSMSVTSKEGQKRGEATGLGAPQDSLS